MNSVGHVILSLQWSFGNRVTIRKMSDSVTIFFWILICQNFGCALASAGFSGNEFHAHHFLYRENFLIILDLALIEEPLVVRTERELMHCYFYIAGHFIIALCLCLFRQVIYPGGFSLSPCKNFPIPLIILAVCESFLIIMYEIINHQHILPQDVCSAVQHLRNCALNLSASRKIFLSVCLSQSLLVGY